MTKRKLPADPLQAFAASAMPVCLCMNMRMATRRLVAYYEAHLAESGLNISQFGLLASIAAKPGITMSALAETLELSPSTLTRTLRPLEEDGLIEIVADKKSRRQRLLKLTGEGHKRLTAAGDNWKTAHASAREIVSPKVVEQLLKATEKLA
jgi:DNA-binding MarR family transcriptional regulator